MRSGGNVISDESGKVIGIEEGDHSGKPGSISTNLFVLDTRLFNFPLVPKSIGSDEYGLPQTVLAASQSSGIHFEAVAATFWVQITAPEDIREAELILQARGH